MYGQVSCGCILILNLALGTRERAQSYAVNVSVLETAHSIFARWRSETRSNELFTVINFVLGQFSKLFPQVFRYAPGMLLDNPLPARNEAETVAQAMVVLLHIFYDLACQDLPPALEDTHCEFFGAESSMFTCFLLWHSLELQTDPDKPTAGVPSRIKTAIFELTGVYTHRYRELLISSDSVEVFVRVLWSLIKGQDLPTITSLAGPFDSLARLFAPEINGNIREPRNDQ